MGSQINLNCSRLLRFAGIFLELMLIDSVNEFDSPYEAQDG